MIPVCGELVVGEFAGLADGELDQASGRSARRDVVQKGEQISIGRGAELAAVECQQGDRNRVRAGYPEGGSQAACVGRAAVGGRNIRDESADQRSWGVAATLARALIVNEEKAKPSTWADRAAEAPAKNILLNDRTRGTGLIQKVLIGIEGRVSKEFIYIAMKLMGAALQDGVNVAATVAALGGVIQRGLNLEFLHDVRVG